MSSRQHLGGLLKYKLWITFLHVASIASQGADSHGGLFHPRRGEININADLRNQFDQTVSEVKDLLNLTDKTLLEKLNHTIYKGLLNHVITQSGLEVEFHGAIPEADEKIVDELEKAGFVALARLARKDIGGFTVDSGLTSAASCAPRSPYHTEGDTHNDIFTNHVKPSSDCHKTTTQVKNNDLKSEILDPGARQSTVHESPRCRSNLSYNGSQHKKACQHDQTMKKGQTDNSNLTTSEGRSNQVSKPRAGDTTDDHNNDALDNHNRLVNDEGLPFVENDLFWSAEIEAASPKGFSQQELDQWKKSLFTKSVQSIEPGDLETCGRDKNRLITLEDGSRLCARYRYPLITSMTGLP